MKSPENTVQVKRFAVDATARKVSDLEHMIREFEAMAADLHRLVHTEEARTGIKDPRHFAYSTFAKSTSLRRENLLASVADLRLKLESALREHEEAEAQLTRVGTPEMRSFRSRRRPDRISAVGIR